jgi:hypothetical protein
MNHRLAAALVALVLGFALFASVANAKVTILDSDSGKEVDTITKGKCGVPGKKGSKDFVLFAKSENGRFLLNTFIDYPTFVGFNESYTAYYGGTDPQIFLRRNSDDEVFSNFKIPGTPAGTVGAGAIAFRKDGRRVGIGLYAASNKSFTEGYSFAGSISCKYPKKRR